MVRRTKKVGISGKYGARYGVKIRRRISEIESKKNQRHQCPQCQYQAVKRLSSGIWICNHCNYKFTGGAYLPCTAVGVSRREALRIAKAEKTTFKGRIPQGKTTKDEREKKK